MIECQFTFMLSIFQNKWIKNASSYYYRYVALNFSHFFYISEGVALIASSIKSDFAANLINQLLSLFLNVNSASRKCLRSCTCASYTSCYRVCCFPFRPSQSVEFYRKLTLISVSNVSYRHSWALLANWWLIKVQLLFFSFMTGILTMWTQTSHVARLRVYQVPLCSEGRLTFSLVQVGMVYHQLWLLASIQLQLKCACPMT